MNGKSNSPPNGQESSGTADELHTDGGVSRRVFLGAAAALSTLTAVSGSVVAEGDGGDDGPCPGCFRSGDGTINREDVSEDLYFRNGSYVIKESKSVLDPLALRFEPGGAEVTVRLTPERAEELARDLKDAAQCYRQLSDGGEF